MGCLDDSDPVDGICHAEGNVETIRIPLVLPAEADRCTKVGETVVCKSECEDEIDCEILDEDGNPCGQMHFTDELSAKLALSAETGAVAGGHSYTRTIVIECSPIPGYGPPKLEQDDGTGEFFCVAQRQGKAKAGAVKQIDTICPVGEPIRGTNVCFAPTMGACPSAPVPAGELSDITCGPITLPYIGQMRTALTALADKLDEGNERYRTCVHTCGAAVYRWAECITIPPPEEFLPTLAKLYAAKKYAAANALTGRIVACMAAAEKCEILSDEPYTQLRNGVKASLERGFRALVSKSWEDYVYSCIPLGFTTKIQSALQEAIMEGGPAYLASLNSEAYHTVFSQSSEGPGKSCRAWAKGKFTMMRDSAENPFDVNGRLTVSFDDLFANCEARCTEKLFRSR